MRRPQRHRHKLRVGHDQEPTQESFDFMEHSTACFLIVEEIG
jgi:hypothetical protein